MTAEETVENGTVENGTTTAPMSTRRPPDRTMRELSFTVSAHFHFCPIRLRGFLIHPTKNFRHFPIPLKQWDESDFFENRTPRRDARDERAQTARVRRETSFPIVSPSFVANG